MAAVQTQNPLSALGLQGDIGYHVDDCVPDPLHDSDVVVAVIGCGYVGENLLREFGHVYPSIGYEISAKRAQLLRGLFEDVTNVEITTESTNLSRATHFLISVPTELNKDNSVDFTHLVKAINTVTNHARKGATVVIESSVCVGTTRTLLTNLAATFGLKCGMSPERVDPGRISPPAKEIPKIVSGLDERSLASIHRLYSSVYDRVIPVSKPEVAEMTKLFENCYRMINIAYVNEIADACEKQGIDVNEVVEAASTKPFGFQRFNPGLGIGGHCIPVNPHYLMANNDLPLLKAATEKTDARPGEVARRLSDAYSEESVEEAPPRVLIVGVGFKPGQSLTTRSPALTFAKSFHAMGCNELFYYDPLVSCIQGEENWIEKLKDEQWTVENLEQSFDIVAVCVKQPGIDLEVVEKLENTQVIWF